MFRCVTITPFGTPVVPEVKRRYASSSGDCGWRLPRRGPFEIVLPDKDVSWPTPRERRQIRLLGHDDQEVVIDSVQNGIELLLGDAIDDQRAALRLLEHPPGSHGWKVRIEWDVRAAGQQRAKDPGKRGDRTVRENRGHWRAARRRSQLQRRRKACSPLAKLAIGQALRAELERGAKRHRLCRPQKPRMQKAVWHATLGPRASSSDWLQSSEKVRVPLSGCQRNRDVSQWTCGRSAPERVRRARSG